MVVSHGEADDGAEVHTEEENTEAQTVKRTQLLIVVLVVVLYLLCQSSVVYFAGSIQSPFGYSGDRSFVANSTNAGVRTRVERLQQSCEVERETGDRLENNRTSSKTIDPTFESNTSNSSVARIKVSDDTLESYVFRVMEEQVNNKTCHNKSAYRIIIAHYYLCNSLNLLEINYRLIANGTLTVINGTIGEANDCSEFPTFVEEFSGYEILISYRMCESDKPEREGFLELMSTGLKVALPIPIATTLVVYYYLPQLRNLPGTIIVCKLWCELANSFWPWFDLHKEKFFELFAWSFVAGITWTSILCYDLWSTCGGCLQTSRRAERDRKFLHYSLVGWGHPALFTIVIFCAKDRILSRLKQVVKITMYVVYIFLNVLNLLFFTFTVKNIRKHNSNNLLLVERGRQGGSTAGGTYFYVRISVLMGILSFISANVDICMLTITHSEDKVAEGIILGLSFIDKILHFTTLVYNKRVLKIFREKFIPNSVPKVKD